MNRDDIPTFPITKPGEYETRGGMKAVVELRTNRPDAASPWLGYRVSDGHYWADFWADSGESSVELVHSPNDIIGPWIEGGLPFGEVLNPATSSPELLRRYKDARDARMPIEYKLYDISEWTEIGPPRFNSPTSFYRLKGSTAEPTQQTPEQSAVDASNCCPGPIVVDEATHTQLVPLTRDDVREIVKEVLKEMLT